MKHENEKNLIFFNSFLVFFFFVFFLKQLEKFAIDLQTHLLVVLIEQPYVQITVSADVRESKMF